MKAPVTVLFILAMLALVAGCSGANVYQPAPDSGGHYNFSAGDASSPYPPYHHPSH